MVCGWVNTYRDHSTGLVFIDLRDREGLVQVVFDGDDAQKDVLEIGRSLRREDVAGIKGVVRARAGGANPKLASGEIEILVTEAEVLAKTETTEAPLHRPAASPHAVDPPHPFTGDQACP